MVVSTGSLDPHDAVGQALKLLADALASFVEQRMLAVRGPNWFDAFSGQSYGPGYERALKDPRFLLKVMVTEWDAFSPPLSRTERNLVFELRDTGNRWAHNEPFTRDDADRAFDSVERLLRPFDTGAADRARRARDELRRRVGPQGSPREVPQGAPAPDREGRLTNAQLILMAACALTAAGHTPFARIDIYRWIWERYPRSEHDRPALDPTFQGMSDRPGGPPSAVGKPLRWLSRGLYELVDPDSSCGDGNEFSSRSRTGPHWATPNEVAGTELGRSPSTVSDSTLGGSPGYPISSEELARLGFVPLNLQVYSLDVDLSSGRGCDWTTLGEVPEGPGLYAFTVEDKNEIRVTYVGRTEHLWMVTKGRLPGGGGRGGQRYGRHRHAGATRQRINVLVAEQIRVGRGIRHWVRQLPIGALRAEEERLITEWDLRRIGWNRG